ncbi:MAG: hypothetical protein K8R46_13480 [Pirellulales bacterium]|nr:hypothetical protein [Pirellulales bacterium]
MKSEIEYKLTEKERHILGLYRNPKASDFRRQIRLSVQYAISTGIFLGLAIWWNQALYALVVYVTFVFWMFLRLRGAYRVSGIMPTIIEKYELEIAKLRSELGDKANSRLP